MSDIEEQREQARDQQQQAVYASAPLFVRACPGAGKTRVLVDRHCHTPPGRRRTGRALLSFTNVAADELRERCTGRAGRTDLTVFPHYIGTFDSFLWRYLVRPFLPAAPPWQHVLSWDHVPGAIVGPRKVPLPAFDFRYDPTTRHTSVAWPTAGQYLHNSQLTEDDYLARARTARERLWQTNGYMTGLEVRIAALEHAGDPACTDLLAHRFFEIIVDEAQDCSALDLAILTRLHRAGIPLVIVADTDQGIYEWNDARPEELHEFTQAIGDHLELTGNWRSSPAICQLAATLRPAARRTPDIAVGDHHDAARPLLLLPYGKHRKQTSALTSSTDAGEVFTAWASHADIDAVDCLALAHRNIAVPKARTRPAPQLPKDQNAIALAWTAAVFSATDTSPASRAHALTAATTFLREYWYPDEPGTLTELLAQHDLSPALLRRRAAAFLHALPTVDEAPAREWRKQARLILQNQTPPTRAIASAPPKLLSLPTADLDKPIRSLIGLPEQTDEAISTPTMRSSSIHQAKGSEAEAVLIHLPKPQDITKLIDAWTSPSTDTESSELLRVYYVAITRARRLLALTYPYSKHSDVTALLDVHHIEYQTETEPPPPTAP
ncbi:UvrD-helicase domain-containing protein [Streptomyces sp. NPDC002476]|uniref:UvrD-helicase domain-containing protein n=1 Tax=Streptomyces sp. NPDC002476 TaxID=3364648 RepID=UPI0036B310DC